VTVVAPFDQDHDRSLVAPPELLEGGGAAGAGHVEHDQVGLAEPALVGGLAGPAGPGEPVSPVEQAGQHGGQSRALGEQQQPPGWARLARPGISPGHRSR